MALVHYLNVGQGDCSIIQHHSNNISVVDVCNARLTTDSIIGRTVARLANEGTLGRFRQKDYPVNPIDYMQERGITSVFRFILTNPDMDHMDGIKAFFKAFSPINFWDTENTAVKESWEGGPYDEEDWRFYTSMRDGKPLSNPKRLTHYVGDSGKFWNISDDGKHGGDGLHILAPTRQLIEDANRCGDCNDCSYVLLYLTGRWKILFAGDSHDNTWRYILDNHAEDVSNVDILIAPHHGRASDRSYEFLGVVNPRLTFFGNAPSEHLAYDAWRNRGLDYVTNNQAGSLIVETQEDVLYLYSTHKPFAEERTASSFYSDSLKAYFAGVV